MELQGSQVVATEPIEIVEDVTTPRRDSDVTAWVNVIYGCNEKCTYCIVPATRGAEQSRTPEAIRRCAPRSRQRRAMLLVGRPSLREPWLDMPAPCGRCPPHPGLSGRVINCLSSVRLVISSVCVCVYCSMCACVWASQTSAPRALAAGAGQRVATGVLAN